MSSILITTLSHCSGHTDSPTERCWAISTGSWSLTVVPSTTLPTRGITSVAASSASTSVVLPAPEWPTSATLRIFSGRSAVSTTAVAAVARAPGFAATFLFDIAPLSSPLAATPEWYSSHHGPIPAFDTQPPPPTSAGGRVGPAAPAIVGATFRGCRRVLTRGDG